MGLTGCAALHGLVVGVEVGVVIDLQCLWVESGGDLNSRWFVSERLLVSSSDNCLGGLQDIVNY